MIEINYKSTNIIAISDTHGFHRKLNLPKCDILIHCGDACSHGNEEQLQDFFKWFSEQQASHKIFVAGNHDLMFDKEPDYAITTLPKNIIYLENSLTTINGIGFYSAPARPWLHQHPKIEIEIDFLITHGPSYSILDENRGCKTLLKFIKIQKPKYHLFGHNHSNAGLEKKIGDTRYINVGSLKWI